MTAASRTPPGRARTDAERPDWFRAFLTDRATRKPSPHTLQAYRQDFDAIATRIRRASDGGWLAVVLMPAGSANGQSRVTMQLWLEPDMISTDLTTGP